jgi:hypothetical protein
MKKLPIGIQELSEIINNGYVYVDKTENIYKLFQGKYYFFSRPRRFGKSLLISTLNEIFSGNKELFKDLWIYDKIEWGQYPIIRIDFSKIGYKEIGLNGAILLRLNEIAEQYNVPLTSKTIALAFKELIEKISNSAPVVILIDEYDKPIIDHIEDLSKAEESREILKNFYSIIKGNDTKIRFFFMTGVSKFSKVSIFSDLNNLFDITLDQAYSTLVGITQDELEQYFAQNIELLKERYKEVFPDLLPVIKEMYNGYSWDGKSTVYNPFSILNLFSGLRFDNYWFATGTPTFLLKLIKQNNYTALDFEDLSLDSTLIDKFEINSISAIGLLFQTGYLTVKKYDLARNSYTLYFPNKEVENSFARHLLSEFSELKYEKSGVLIYELEKAFNLNNVEKIISIFKTLLANITYPNVDDKEKYYHSIFYLTLKLLGYNIESEIMTIDGRIDATVFTDTHVYIMEFKLGEPQKALQQIKDKNYALKYLNQNKQIVLLGIGFDVENKCLGGYEMEQLL